jgi:hypothetical protein
LKIFLDNDIIIKLASLDLLVYFKSLLKADCTEIICLPSLFYILKKKPLQGQAQQRAENFITSCRKLSPTYLVDLDIDANNELLLITCPGIDAGEAQLLLAALASPDSIILTGDKRCLTALCQTSTTVPLVPKLQARVLILEQLILEMINTFGFEDVKASALKGVYCDTAIRSSFGSGMEAEESNVISTLKSYIREVNGCCPGILAAANVLNGLT